ncbi:RNase P subunit p30-domain-containing protein [Scheffersomyces coipomensis]|uniref:RNase P subunit p30-domain-containing protein n=1 Tax=Scheffersomyces coipomensis TaxID=1788519 RepID=UPI00315C502A
MLYDLNVPWPVNDYHTKPTDVELYTLKNTIVTLHTLGYDHIAINFQITESVKIPLNQTHLINPIDIASLQKSLSPQFPSIKLFSRLTIVIYDPAKLQGLAKLQAQFDILAIQPLTEKALQLSTTNLDIDLISFNLGAKLPFYLKHKTIGSAVDKGIKFEICYNNLISGSIGYANSPTNPIDNIQFIKKNFIYNVLQLVRSSRSKGLIISSGATLPLQTRNSEDILNLLRTFGLDQSRSKSCVTINPERVLVNGRLRIKSFKQTIVMDNNEISSNSIIDNDKEDPKKKTDSNGYKKRLDSTSSGRLLKKQRKR